MSTPDVYNLQLDKNDEFLVLASDGVWDFLSDEDVVDIVSKSTNPDTAAANIVESALQVAANERGMTIEQLKALPEGSARRGRHDDTTAVVMYLK